MTDRPAVHGIHRYNVGTGRAQEKRVADRHIIDGCVGTAVRGKQALVSSGPEYVIAEGQSAHRGPWLEDLHAVRVRAAWVMARVLEIVKRLVGIARVRPLGAHP